MNCLAFLANTYKNTSCINISCALKLIWPLCLFFPFVSMEIVVNEYVLIQSGERQSAIMCVLNEAKTRNETTERIDCALECNRIPECIGIDLVKNDQTMCSLLFGFASLKPSVTLKNRTFRYQKASKNRVGREEFCNVSLTTGQIISSLCHINDNQWTIIQRRMDGSVDFKRNWTEYENGFGSLNSEFWIGNSNLFSLTSDGYTHLRIELMDHNCVWKYAEYGLFYIQDKTNKYRMHVSSYSGNAGDSFSYHDNMEFSTSDNDNDQNAFYNCALGRFGGWWYNSCHRANLNGEYGNIKNSEGINWNAWMGFTYSMTETRMMLRKP